MTRTDLVQSLGTGLALLISVMALVVSIRETNLLQEQQRASVWPYLTVSPKYDNTGFSIITNNNGIGPALVHSVEVSLEGQYFESWEAILDFIAPGHQIDYDILKTGQLNKLVMKAGDESILFKIPWNSDKYRTDSEPYDIAKQMNKGRIRVCYCSVMDECWVFDSDTKDLVPGKVTFEKPFQK